MTITKKDTIDAVLAMNAARSRESTPNPNETFAEICVAWAMLTEDERKSNAGRLLDSALYELGRALYENRGLHIRLVRLNDSARCESVGVEGDRCVSERGHDGGCYYGSPYRSLDRVRLRP